MLVVRELSKTYDGDFLTPARVSFVLDETTRLVIIDGDNGSGKTTLLKLLTREEEPTSGSFDLRFPEEVTILYQHDGVLPEVSGLTNLRLTRAASEDIGHALRKVNLSRQTAILPAKLLSGGEERRLQLARSIASGRRFWILDEPASHADGNFKALLLELILDHVAKNGYALLVSHDQAFKSRISEAAARLTTVRGVVLNRTALRNEDDYSRTIR